MIRIQVTTNSFVKIHNSFSFTFLFSFIERFSDYFQILNLKTFSFIGKFSDYFHVLNQPYNGDIIRDPIGKRSMPPTVIQGDKHAALARANCTPEILSKDLVDLIGLEIPLYSDAKPQNNSKSR